MTETRVMRIATGQTRQITTWFEGGWVQLPVVRRGEPTGGGTGAAL